MTVFEFKVTSANINDSKLLITLFLSVSSTNMVKPFKEMYGDDAYNTKQNRNFLMEHDMMPLFHTKEEKGKNPQNKRSAKKISKNLSKIEVLYGTSQENLGFGKVRVRGLSKVSIYTSFIFTGWNFGILYSYFINQFDDLISLKRLLHKI